MKVSGRKRILLVGGGHAHAVLLRDTRAAFFEKFDVQVISESEFTIYSGMMTGCLAGDYEVDQIQIDIQALCTKRGAGFIKARAKSLDTDLSQIFTEDGQRHGFDLLSLDTGSESDPNIIPGAAEFGLALRPFKNYRFRVLEKLAQHKKSAPFSVVQIGGGAAGCECAAALLRLTQAHGLKVDMTIVEKSTRLMKEAPVSVGKQLAEFFRKKGVSVRFNCETQMIGKDFVQLNSGESLRSSLTSLALPPRAGRWLESLNLKRSAEGSVCVNAYLQTSKQNVFAAGDIAEFTVQRTPKAGVFAVREAPILAENLMAAALGLPLKRFEPQKAWLSLLSDSEGGAFGYRGNFHFPHSRLTWLLKDWIDQRFVRSFL
jgi:selenide,water dikinase